MSATNPKKSSAPEPSREERIEAVVEQLRPQIEQVVRQMVERAVDVPEAEEFGAIDTEFRDAGQNLVTDVRQARKKGYVGCSVTCPDCQYAAKFHFYHTKSSSFK
ncbi:hypothetical protein GobsT_43390 [Gemmata obscuriglobus]|nr:hypothetical protein [Gemmata obscuriglobus]QEG29543.1 hypothetical protein GobsT_43390 [Gemmata obscuriglobus]VTS08761.1 unnamed protein product [Gemmata obscuriglobus UQM 2246]